jgi:hypothetical protein
MCSTGDLSYGSWSAECCEYLASLSCVCREMVPSTGLSAPVIRLSRVDLPVPLSPTMAILADQREGAWAGAAWQRPKGVCHRMRNVQQEKGRMTYRESMSIPTLRSLYR